MRDLPSQFQPKSKKHNCNLKTGGVNENVRQRVGSLIRNPEVQKSRQSSVLFVGAKRHGLFSFDTSLSRVVSCTPTDHPALREFAPRQRTLRKQGDEERSSFDEISKMVSLGDVPCGRVRPSDLFSPRSNHHQL